MCFSNLNNTPGIVPEDPAVGVAQMIPIAAFTSLVATAPLTLQPFHVLIRHDYSRYI